MTEQRDALVQAGLTDKQQHVLVQRWEGRSYEQIGLDMLVSPVAVFELERRAKARLARAGLGVTRSLHDDVSVFDQPCPHCHGTGRVPRRASVKSVPLPESMR